MHYRPPGRPERRIVPQQLKIPWEVGNGIVRIGRARGVRAQETGQPAMTMDPEAHYRLAVQRIAETHRQAERARAARSPSPRRQLRITEAVRTRLAFLLVQIGLRLLARSRRTRAQTRTTGVGGAAGARQCGRP
jgi:hypothetical protein